MRKITAFVIAAVFSIFFLQPETANAVTSTSFNFTGTCTEDCTGTATATLVLQNYTIGNPLTIPNFVSFAYHSSIFPNFKVDGPPILQLQGAFNSLPGAATVFLSVPNSLQIFDFASFTNGDWCFGTQCGADNGVNGTWSVAPAVP